MAARRRPVGILAAALAAAIAVGGLMASQTYALHLAEGHLQSVASGPLPIKYETLTFQRAAFAVSGELPMYGSSELFCCGQPDLPTQFFAQAPAGFHPFAIGRAGTGDLMFLETFGALGSAVRGRRVVVSVSPEWFYGRAGITAGYDGNFSPEVATVFVYDAPLPIALREAAARQMAAHPATLAGQGLLRLGVQALAAGNLPLYYALLPAGRLDAWALQLKDAWQTIAFVEGIGAAPAAPRRTVRQALAVRAAAARSVATEGIGGGVVATVTTAVRGAVTAVAQAFLRAVAPPAATLAPGSRVAPGSAARSQAPSAGGSALGSASAVGSTAAAGSASAGASRPASASGSAAAAGSASTVGSASAGASRPASAARSLTSAAGSLSPSRSGVRGAGAGRGATALAIQPVGPPPVDRPLLAVLTQQASGPPASRPIDWRAKLAAATALANTLAGSDPFGFLMSAPSLRVLEPALRVYCAGASNAAGGLYPFPAQWAANMRASAEWTAMGLELQALRDLGARALVWSVPFQGYYDNYTQMSQPARQVYYRRFLQVAAPSGFPAVDFAQADGDRLFIANVGNHFSARGWVVANRVLDLFWHGQARAIPGTIAAMLRMVPPPPPAQALACPGNAGGMTHAGARAAG